MSVNYAVENGISVFCTIICDDVGADLFSKLDMISTRRRFTKDCSMLRPETMQQDQDLDRLRVLLRWSIMDQIDFQSMTDCPAKFFLIGACTKSGHFRAGDLGSLSINCGDDVIESVTPFD